MTLLSVPDLRKKCIEKRKDLQTDTKEYANLMRSLSKHILMCLSDLEINYPMELKKLGFYYPIRYEPDLRNSLLDWQKAKANRVLALPLTAANEPLNFSLWTENTPMIKGYANIPEPKNTLPIDVDIILAPCVGWKSDGHQFWRLGYGGGFYDRTLAHLHQQGKRTIILGIAFDSLKLENSDWQTLEHDWPLDGMITESFFQMTLGRTK
jgi:5,10-methenyltetrahydrofolate synthetase